jgi:molecular chaperone GrpE
VSDADQADQFFEETLVEPEVSDEGVATPSGTEAPGDAVTDTGEDHDAAPVADPDTTDLSVQDLVETLESVSAQRDSYLDSLRRLQAEFENYKKAVAKRTADERERANDDLVQELLPVLDACDAAISSGIELIEPVRNQLLAALQRHGLELSDPADALFNPEEHEAVMHEPADDLDQPTVAEVLRTGYLWKGRVLRPAMVRVKG